MILLARTPPRYKCSAALLSSAHIHFFSFFSFNTVFRLSISYRTPTLSTLLVAHCSPAPFLQCGPTYYVAVGFWRCNQRSRFRSKIWGMTIEANTAELVRYLTEEEA